jgi:putative nucleotidyltransferase with HDIG domain
MTDPLDIVREALVGEEAWLVGGALRDRLLGRTTEDLDLALAGDARRAARGLANATGGAPFRLSDAFGAWRVVGPERAWQVDLVPLREGGLEADLAARDLTINALAEPLAGGTLVDPHGGAEDLEAHLLRMVSPGAFLEDPLRVVRLARQAHELGFAIDDETAWAARAAAPQLDRTAPERVFAELRRIVSAPEPEAGVALLMEVGAAPVVLPELTAMRGVEQNVFHHRDVYGHTLEVLREAAALHEDPGAALGPELAEPLARHLAEPLADEMTRGQALRLAALLHDVAKPRTRGVRPDGRVTFIGHDAEGADMVRAALRRLRASERLVEYVAALTRHHLRLGFLVHEQPLSRRSVWRYLTETAPYDIDVTLLTVADRLATRGRNADAAIAAHLELSRQMLAEALARRAAPPEPIVRGDELARALGIAPGPELGELLAQLEEDRFVGEIATADDAIRRARELRSARR